MLKRKKFYAKLKAVFKVEKIKKCIVDIKHELLKKASANEKISTTWLVKTVYNFCQIYSEITYYPYQEQFAKRVIRSLLENDGEEISALFSRQTGRLIVY